MNLIPKSHIKRKNVAICLLFAFSTAFLCDLICDISFIDTVESHHHKNHFFDTQPIASGHQISHHYSHFSSETKFEHGKKDDQKECCEGSNPRVYDSIFKQESSRFDLVKIQPTLFESLNLTGYDQFRLNKIPHILKNVLSPPKGGRFMRVFFQSFLC